MSECRCDERTIYENKIKRLKKAGSSMDGLSSQLAYIDNELFTLGVQSKTMYEGDNREELESLISSLDNDMKISYISFRQKISNKITSLEAKLDEINKEDKDYHDNEKKNENINTSTTTQIKYIKTDAEIFCSLVERIAQKMNEIDEEIITLVEGGIEGRSVQTMSHRYIENRDVISDFVKRFAATACVLHESAEQMKKNEDESDIAAGGAAV